ITIRVSVRGAHVRPAKRCGFEIAFDAARESAGTIDESAESPQPQRVCRKACESSDALKPCVEVGRAEAQAIPHETLIEAAVNADGLLRTQGRVSDSLRRIHNHDLAEPLEQRGRAKAVADVSAKFSIRR